MNRFLSYFGVFILGILVCVWSIWYLYGSPQSFGPQRAPSAPRGGVKLVSTSANQVREAAKLVSEYVVNIDTVGRPVRGLGPGGLPDLFDLFGSPVRRGEASGVIFNPDGYIVTNNHVVEDAAQLNVTLHDGSRFPAKLIGRDPKTDLAVIKISAHGLKYAQFAKSNTLEVGDWVLAVGNALGLGPTVTIGVVSAKRSEFDIDGKVFEGVIQTDAAINRGNSGGALADINGDLVGINTAIASTSPGGGSIGIGFAIPSNTAEKIADQLMKKGKVVRPWLGISYVGLNDAVRADFRNRGVTDLPKQDGALIGTVYQGSPAAEAGLQPGDVILKINGRPVSGKKEPEKGKVTIVKEMQKVKVGDRVLLQVWRASNSRIASVAVHITEMPPDFSMQP